MEDEKKPVQDPLESQNDEALARMFKDVKPRVEPRTEAYHAAMGLAREEWQTLVKQRRNRRNLRWMAYAAAFGLVSILLTFWQQPQEQDIAIDLLAGELASTEGKYNKPLFKGGHQIQTGDIWQANRVTRLLVEADLELRLAKQSQIRWLSQERIELLGGRVYIATSNGASIEVETAKGIVRDIGTQFIVSLQDDEAQVLVREGRVEIDSGKGKLQSDALSEGRAQRIRFGGTYTNKTFELASTEDWQWIHQAPGGYQGDNPLGLLAAIAKDLGKRLEFEHQLLEAELGNITVSGDFSNMDPESALALLALSCDVEVEQSAERILISR